MSDFYEMPRAEEYETSGEEFWCVRQWGELAASFDLKSDDLPKWHDAMSAQGRAWEMVRRLFGVAPLMDLEADDLREWTEAELATKYGLAVAIVKQEVAGAIAHWQVERARGQVKREVDAISEDELASLTRFSSGQGMSDEVIERLLKAFNFDHIQKDPVLRAEVASRIISLKQWLTSPHMRTAARELIRTEISMHSMDSLLIGYRNRLAKYQEKEAACAMGDNKEVEDQIDDIHVKISNLEKQLREMSKSHADKQESIGANDLDMVARKRIYVETVSYLIEGCRIYESDPENWTMDGVFTAKEIDWLLEPSGERGAQYRMDLVMVANHALRPEHLWDPKYHSAKVPRRVCQELNRMVERLRGVPEDAPDLPDSDEDEEDAGVADDATAVPVDDAGAQSHLVPFEKKEAPPAAGFF